MCRFHKDLAIHVATDPASGGFDPLKYSLTLTALAPYRLEQYMPALAETDGYDPAPLMTPRAKDALAASGLNRPAADRQAYEAGQLPALRAALDGFIEKKGLSLAALNLPADPVGAPAFLTEAAAELYKVKSCCASKNGGGEYALVSAAHKPEFEPLRAATAALRSEPGLEPVFRRLFEDNIVRIFEEAKPAAAPGLRAAFKNCAFCLGSGAGGILAGHAGCFIAPLAVAMAGVTGLTAGTSVLAAVAGTAATAGGLYAWQRLRGSFASATEKKVVVGSALAGLALSLFMCLGGGQENTGAREAQPHHHHHHHMAMQP